MTHQVIDRANGQLIIANDYIISNKTQKADLLNYFGLDNIDIRDLKNGWSHYIIKDVKIGSRFFAFFIFFEHESLKGINFGIDYIAGQTWNDWNEEKELKKLDNYKSWLVEQVGQEQEFTWGSVVAFYDRKGGFSDIVLTYK